MNISGITIILPTLNEEENLKKIIPELVSNFNGLQIENYEILVQYLPTVYLSEDL